MNIAPFVKRIAAHPEAIVYNIGRRGMLNWMSDESYIRLLYYCVFRHMPNLQYPRTFNEKIQWMKLYDRNPLYTRMADKYEAKQFVAERVGAEYTIPTLGVWNSPDEIDFSDLPEQFVLKCTHDSGSVFICKDRAKWDWNAVNKKLRQNLKRNFFWFGREWPYKNIKPRVIAEPYLEDVGSDELRDYKLMCFDGRVRCSLVCSNRYKETGICINFYDDTWELMSVKRHCPENPMEIERPSQYEKMVEIAEKLSKDISFLRVDFYQVGQSLYVGELTFYPASGFGKFIPDSWDFTFGNWLQLKLSNH